MATTLSPATRRAMAAAEIPVVCSSRSKAIPVATDLGDLVAQSVGHLRAEPRQHGLRIGIVQCRKRRFAVRSHLQREAHADGGNRPQAVRGFDLVDEPHALATQD